MKNNDKLNDAIGRVDQKFIDEYMSQQVRRPLMWRGLIAAAVTVALLGAAIAALPFLTKDNPEPGIGLEDHLGNIVHDGGEYIIDDDGKKVLHVNDISDLPSEIRPATGKDIMESAQLVYTNWDNVISTAKKSTSPDELIFIGTKVSNDVYAWTEQVTVTDMSGHVVEYDVASGTTVIKQIEGYETNPPYTATKCTWIQIIGIRIDEVLKNKNTTGYDAGDIIYFCVETSRMIDSDKSPTVGYPEDGVVTDILPPIPSTTEIAIEPTVPEPETQANSNSSATSTPNTGNVTAPPDTVDINGDGIIDDIDTAHNENETQTASSSGQRMYIARVYTKPFSDVVVNSGLLPEKIWISPHSCTAEQYRSGNFPNDTKG